MGTSYLIGRKQKARHTSELSLALSNFLDWLFLSKRYVRTLVIGLILRHACDENYEKERGFPSRTIPPPSLGRES